MKGVDDENILKELVSVQRIKVLLWLRGAITYKDSMSRRICSL